MICINRRTRVATAGLAAAAPGLRPSHPPLAHLEQNLHAGQDALMGIRPTGFMLMPADPAVVRAAWTSSPEPALDAARPGPLRLRPNGLARR
jgi:hypothetical protein